MAWQFIFPLERTDSICQEECVSPMVVCFIDDEFQASQRAEQIVGSYDRRYTIIHNELPNEFLES